jgi:hypothetical protein
MTMIIRLSDEQATALEVKAATEAEHGSFSSAFLSCLRKAPTYF